MQVASPTARLATIKVATSAITRPDAAVVAVSVVVHVAADHAAAVVVATEVAQSRLAVVKAVQAMLSVDSLGSIRCC